MGPAEQGAVINIEGGISGSVGANLVASSVTKSPGQGFKTRISALPLPRLSGDICETFLPPASHFLSMQQGHHHCIRLSCQKSGSLWKGIPQEQTSGVSKEACLFSAFLILLSPGEAGLPAQGAVG